MQVAGVASAEQVTTLRISIDQKVFHIFDSGFDTYADVFQNTQ